MQIGHEKRGFFGLKNGIRDILQKSTKKLTIYLLFEADFLETTKKSKFRQNVEICVALLLNINKNSRSF